MKKLKLKNRKNQKIIGNLEQPSGELRGTCIVQHGYSGFKEQPHVQAMKDAFLSEGFITFTFDTTNSFGESDGKFEDSRLGLHADDLEDVVAWAKRQDWFTEPLALTGSSMGGYSVLAYAEKKPDEVVYCAPIAPVISGALMREAKEENEPGSLKRWEESGWLIKESASKPGVMKRSPWEVMVEYMNHDLIPNADKLTMPIFLFGGTEDTSIPPKHLQILFDAIPEGNKTLKIIEGAPHTYRTEKHLETLRTTLVDWIRSLY